MSQAKAQAAGYHFDEFYLDADNRELRRSGELVALNSKYFDVLLLLIKHGGQLVEKQTIFERVWDGVFVTDAALTQCIKDIRKQLGDDASNPRYIKTVPKHGYLFIGAVTDASPNGNDSETVTEIPTTAQRPFKFLDYFGEQDARLFFGREAEITLLCSQILSHRAFVLHGRSGVGKSSILRAGVMPRLKAEAHLAYVVRSFTDPLHQMAIAVTDNTGDAVREALRSAIERTSRQHEGKLVVFIFDQFEEFFLTLPPEIKGHFVTEIGNLYADAALPVRFVFAVREDLLAEMSEFKTAIPEIFHHEYRLNKLTRQQAARAITEPAAQAGCRFDEDLIARLLVDLGNANGVDPPQLQIVCDNLYDAREANGRLSLALYEQMGGAEQMLAYYLERVMRRFNAGDLQAARKILTALITEDGQRIVLRLADLLARAGGGDAAIRHRLPQVLEELVAARVARWRSQEGESWIELAHDFLTAEVSRWLSAEDVELKRARAVIERASENFRAHGLMVDADALDVILPFGAQLGLSGGEGDLLAASLLNRSLEVPRWLAEAAPSFEDAVREAMKSPESAVRLRAIEAALVIRSERLKSLLRDAALWDRDLLVRKAASVALAEWTGEESERILSDSSATKQVGAIRRAVSLAMVRDYDKRCVRFSNQSPPVALLVFCGLMWVRVRRGWEEIVWQASGGTFGGAVSGLLGGLMLGIGLSVSRQAAFFESLQLTLALVSMGTFTGALGGLGVSFGRAAAQLITYRHSRWWSVIGGAAGGAIVGGSSNLLGVDALRTLSGQTPVGLAGALEGSVIGAGVAIGIVLVTTLFKEARAWQRIVGASVGSLLAGMILLMIGSNLFSGSLEIIARLFADSQLRMDRIASYFGEGHFGRTTQIVFGALEGLMFGAGASSGLELASRLHERISLNATRIVK